MLLKNDDIAVNCLWQNLSTDYSDVYVAQMNKIWYLGKKKKQDAQKQTQSKS